MKARYEECPPDMYGKSSLVAARLPVRCSTYFHSALHTLPERRLAIIRYVLTAWYVHNMTLSTAKAHSYALLEPREG